MGIAAALDVCSLGSGVHKHCSLSASPLPQEKFKGEMLCLDLSRYEYKEQHWDQVALFPTLGKTTCTGTSEGAGLVVLKVILPRRTVQRVDMTPIE